MKIEDIAKYIVRKNTYIGKYLYRSIEIEENYVKFPANFSDKDIEIVKYLINVKQNKGVEEYDILVDKIDERTQELANEKAERAWKSYEKRQKAKEEAGEEIKKELKPMDVVFVEYNGSIWNKTRAIKILGMEEDAFIGRYLDREVTAVPIDEPEEEGCLYARKYWDKSYKWKWDGKTFRSTYVIVTKKYKFIKEKIDNIVILNRK